MTNANKIFVGESGTGKTTNFKQWMLPKIREVGPVFIVDTDGYDYRDVSDVKVEHPRLFKDAVQQGHQVVRWEPTGYTSQSESAGEELDKFVEGADQAFQMLEHMYLVIEEAHEFQIASHMYSSMLERAIRKYRGLGAGVIQLSQNPTDYATASWNNAHDIFGFYMKSVPKKLRQIKQPGTDFQTLRQGEFYHVSADAYQDDRKLRPLSK